MKWFAWFLLTLAVVSGLVLAFGISRPPAQVVQTAQAIDPGYAQPAPVVVVQQPSNDGFWTGFWVNHMLFGHSYYGRGYYGYHAPVQHTTIINNTTHITNRPVIAAPRANTFVYRAPSTYRSSSYRSSSRRR
jgi:hypothetical protein